MNRNQRTTLTVRTIVEKPVELTWKHWNNPEDIVVWYTASDDWQTSKVENNLEPDGNFNYRMEAKDGSFSFNFEGKYDQVTENEKIGYTIADGRKVNIEFIPSDNSTEIVETFEAERTNSLEMQQAGWQAILDNFKKYMEMNF
ncbi:MAG TPA: SRPBCC domain-containing protein [Paludibacter sp.]|nr:SRPBCC domain-containing protein [Paludibacter sp.]